MQILCQVTRSEGGVFLPAQQWSLKNIGKEVANTVLSGYWKGAEADNCNVVIDIEEI